MNQSTFQDPRDGLEASMTPEEAQAVIGMWSMRQRLGSGPHEIAPTVRDVAEGLSIPPEEIQAYLRQIRGTAAVRPKRVRSLKTDLRLAMVIAGLAIFAIGTAVFVNVKRARNWPAPFSRPSYLLPSGTLVRNYGFLTDEQIIRSSESPPRFVFAEDNTLFEPGYDQKPGSDTANMIKFMTEAVGGPLADHTVVRSTPIQKEDIAKALQEIPGQRGYSTSEESALARKYREFVEWRTFKAAYAGKWVQAELPYARVSNKALREAVQKEQQRLIQELAESAISLDKGL